jgi:hypothetical protein
MALAESAMLRERSEVARTPAALKDISELKYVIERPTKIVR